MTIAPATVFVECIEGFSNIGHAWPTCFTLNVIYYTTITFQRKIVLIWKQTSDGTSSFEYNFEINKSIEPVDRPFKTSFGNN